MSRLLIATYISIAAADNYSGAIDINQYLWTLGEMLL